MLWWGSWKFLSLNTTRTQCWECCPYVHDRLFGNFKTVNFPFCLWRSSSTKKIFLKRKESDHLSWRFRSSEAKVQHLDSMALHHKKICYTALHTSGHKRWRDTEWRVNMSCRSIWLPLSIFPGEMPVCAQAHFQVQSSPYYLSHEISQ